MNQSLKSLNRKCLWLLGWLAVAQSVQAQTFTYSTGDLCLGFRKTGTHQEANEVVIDLGQVTQFINLPNGMTIPISTFTAAQISPGSFASFDNLSWSVTGYLNLPSDTNFPGYPKYTLWLTVPRTNASEQSTPPTRLNTAVQQTITPEIVGIFAGAKYISQQIGSTNQFNNADFVQESVTTYPSHLLTDFMGDIVDPTLGTLRDTWLENNLEITTPANFTSAVVSDLYEVRPLTDNQGNPIVDPHTGTNGPAYYVGYFTFNPDGSMTFTRAASSVTPPPPPPAPALTITRSGGSSVISFATTNGAVYTLYGTDLSGLSLPATNWPALGSPITGNGGNTNFIDATTNSSRVYRVGAH